MASLSFGSCMWVVLLSYLLDSLIVCATDAATQHPRNYFPALSRWPPAGGSEACVFPPNRDSRTEFWLPGSAAASLRAAAAATAQTTSSGVATSEPGATGLLLGEVTRYVQQDRWCKRDMPQASRTQQQSLLPHENELRSGPPRPALPPPAAPDQRGGPPPNDSHEDWGWWDPLSDPHGVPDILLWGW